jgi:predicted nucleic acid-binding protein
MRAMPIGADPEARDERGRQDGAAAPRLIVLDASSIAALLLDADAEEHSVAAEPGARLLAPSLLPYEIANVLRRLQSARRLAGHHADQAFADLALLEIEFWNWSLLADRVWELRSNLTSYDASYVALAELTDATLITRDARLARAPGLRCTVALCS